MLDDMKRDIEMLKESNRNIAKEIFKLQDRMDNLGDQMARGFREVLGRFDIFAHEVDLSRRKRKLQDVSFNLLNEKLANHEARIVRVERIEGIQGT
jgi:hypothetical protein